MSAVDLLKICLAMPILIHSASFTITANISNITNDMVSKYTFGVNWYKDGYDTGVYTMCRAGGEGQTRYNYEVAAYNAANDWYFIQEKFDTWQDIMDPCYSDGQMIMTQISAMGWVAKSSDKLWSFSQSKYGQQQSNECDNFPAGTTWCAKDAGNGVLLNGSHVSGNDPNDASERTNSTAQATNYVNLITQRYGANASNFYVMDNEPTIYHEIHFDVHPDGTTYEEEFSILSDYGVAVKKACNKQCKVLAPSSWGWCGYFVDGHDQKLGQDYCTTGPDQKTHNNMALLPWYLQQAQALEKQLGYRVLDYLDVHYYAQAPYVTLSCDESSMDIIMDRLQAPRSLYDWSYTDPSWINDKIALIPRLKAWANEYYPGTKVSLTEWNFGGDTCISSLIASTEALAIMATYGVDIAARWTVPENGSLLVNAWKAFTNYDGDGNSIYERAEDNGMGKGTYGVYTQTSNITAVTGYTFVRHDSSQILVYLFNKDLEDAQVTYKLNNGGNNMYNTNGAIDLFGINALNGLYYMGQVDKSDKPDSSSFTVSIYQWEVVLAVINIE